MNDQREKNNGSYGSYGYDGSYGSYGQHYPASEDDADSIDLSYYFYLLNKNKWQMLSLMSAVTLLAILVAFQITPVYEGTATLLVETPKGKLLAIDEVYGLDTGDRNFLQTQMKIIESREMAKKAVTNEKFNFDRFQEFSPPEQQNWSLFSPGSWFASDNNAQLSRHLSAAELKDRHRTGALLEKISLTNLRGTNLIEVRFRSPNPAAAASIANLLAETYIEAQLEAKMEMTERATGWLTDKLDGLRKNLAVSEEALQRFQEQEKLVESKGGTIRGSGLDELESIEDELNRVRTRRLELERLVQEIEKLGREKPSELESHPAILSLDSVKESRRIRLEAEREIRTLAERYGPKHPKMIVAQSTLRGAREQLALQVQVEIESIQKELRGVVASEINMQGAQDNSKLGLQNIGRKEFQLTELKRNVETDRQLYQTFFTRFKETDATEGLYSANARISDHAVIPFSPVAPNKKVIVLMAAFLSFLFAFFIAWLRDYLDKTLRTPNDIEMKLAINVLGSLPLLGQDEVDTIKPGVGIYEDQRFDYYTECMRTIRTSVILSDADTPHKVMVVTSSVPGEGKSSIAYGLARAMGQMGKVLLIDADMRKPTIASKHGIDAKAPGLVELVAGVKYADECIVKSEAGIDVLPAGTPTSNPLVLVSSQKFADILSRLKEEYDHVIIDSPPSQIVSDALVLSRMASALIYVVKADSTSHQVAKLGLRRLHEVDAKIIGVILNQFDAETAQKYSYAGRYEAYDSVSYTYRDYHSRNHSMDHPTEMSKEGKEGTAESTGTVPDNSRRIA